MTKEKNIHLAMRERDALYLKLESYDIRKRTTDNSRHTRILTKIIDFDNNDLGVTDCERKIR